jgi:hypothetical protein
MPTKSKEPESVMGRKPSDLKSLLKEENKRFGGGCHRGNTQFRRTTFIAASKQKGKMPSETNTQRETSPSRLLAGLERSLSMTRAYPQQTSERRSRMASEVKVLLKICNDH